MPQVVISEAAQADIKRLHQFLFKKSPDAALRAVQAIRQAFKPLRENPELGRPLEEEPGRSSSTLGRADIWPCITTCPVMPPVSS